MQQYCVFMKVNICRSQDWGSLLATDPTLPLTFGAPLVRAHQAEHGTRIQDVPAAYNGLHRVQIYLIQQNRTRVSIV